MKEAKAFVGDAPCNVNILQVGPALAHLQLRRSRPELSRSGLRVSPGGQADPGGSSSAAQVQVQVQAAAQGHRQ